MYFVSLPQNVMNVHLYFIKLTKNMYYKQSRIQNGRFFPRQFIYNGETASVV